MIHFAAPVGSNQRALFYSQLATMLGTGMPILRVLGQLLRNPPSAAISPVCAHLLACLEQGHSFTEAFASLPGGIPDFDLALIAAGERSGRLDQSFSLLARHLFEHTANLQKMVQEAAYPILVLHLGALIAPLPALVRDGAILGYFLRAASPLVVCYGTVAFLVWSFRRQRGRVWRSSLERMLLRLPLVGSAGADMALSRLASALSAQLNAGILITEAWPAAAAASGSPLLQRTVEGWADIWPTGITPGELVLTSGVFPESFASAYASGEVSGRLEEQLDQLARRHEEEGFRKLRLISLWAPRLFYGGVSLWIAGQILSIAGSYSATVNELLSE
jgi:type II secretory pathway component PulF